MVSLRVRARDEQGTWTRSITALAILGYLLAAGTQLAVLLTIAPRLFWVEDAMTQYGPAMWWLGQHHDGLLPPLMDPDLGSASNFVADMQYGVLDPFHWLLQAWAAGFDDIVAFSRWHGSLCILLIGSAALLQLRLRRVHPVLAVAGAVGVGSSGFLLWQAASWWPLLWGAGWLLWTWNGLALRGRRGLVVLGISSAALFSCGYPYLLPVAAVLVVGHLVEAAVRRGTIRALWDSERLWQYLALTAGLVFALPTLASMLEASDVILRSEPDPLLGNSGFGIPNVVDLVLGGPTLLPQMIAGINLVPAASYLVLGPALLPLVEWRRAWRLGGVITAAVTAGAALAATQLPSVIGPFRHPFLNVVSFQLVMPLLVLAATAGALRLTRPRMALAAGVVVAQLLLALSRTPVFLGWHLLGGAVTAIAVAGGVSVLRGVRWRAVWAVLVVAAVVVLPVVSMGLAGAVDDRRVEALPVGRSAAEAERSFSAAQGSGVAAETIEEFRARAEVVDTRASVYPFGEADLTDAYWSGFFQGHQNLLVDVSAGYGYDQSVVQEARAEHDCRSSGFVCDARALMRLVPGTTLRWIDVLSQDDVYISPSAPADLLEHLQQRWVELPETARWLHFRRADTLPGRITMARDVDVDRDGAEVGYGRPGSAMERYVVSTGATAGELVFWTTYWPGLQVTLDGRALPPSALDGALLRVEVPAGVDSADLVIAYEPIGARLLWPCLVTAPLLLLLAAGAPGVLHRWRRGREHSGGPTAADPASPTGEVAQPEQPPTAAAEADPPGEPRAPAPHPPSTAAAPGRSSPSGGMPRW